MGVCLCVRSACTPPLLAGVCGVGVCSWNPEFGCAPPLLAGLLGCVCRCAPSGCIPPFLAAVCDVWVGCCLAPVPVSWFVAGCACCPGGRCLLAPVRVPWLWPAACLCGVPRGPVLVRRASSGPVALGAPVGFPDTGVPLPNPRACAPGFTARARGARGGPSQTPTNPHNDGGKGG